MMNVTSLILRKLRRRGCLKGVYCLCIGLILVIIIKSFRRTTLDWSFESTQIEETLYRGGAKHAKWIVVTTIHAPTPQLEALSKVPGWKMVVIGDRTTPTDWKLAGCIFLDVKAQKALDYRITRLLSYDSYTRKNIGYLYAIENGAEWIYETDDDNGGDDLTHFWLSARPVDALNPANNPALFNPYPHFGQSTVWPRGYPLDEIGHPASRQYQLCRLHCPAIQQGLADGDPDVDALFRLTRYPSTPLGLRFDRSAPSVGLQAGTMAPYNSQNTLHAGKAFFALLLPVTVSDRATDIYRSYWAQRLLWLVGGNVVYHPPTSYHQRNAHSSLFDSVQEQQMARETGRLVGYLARWQCNALFLFDCLVELTRHMVLQGFLQQRDVDMVSAWVTDLAAVGYAPPLIEPVHKCPPSAISIDFRPVEQPTTFAHLSKLTQTEADVAHRLVSAAYLSKLCRGVRPLGPSNHSNTLLVMTVGSEARTAIPLAQLALRVHFTHVIYCGTDTLNSLQDILTNWTASYISLPTADAMSCASVAIRMNYSVTGVLHMSHRIAIEPPTLPTNAIDKLWLTNAVTMATLCQRRGATCQRINQSVFTRLGAVKSAVPETDTCLESVSTMVQSRRPAQMQYHEYAPFYVPQRLMASFKQLVGQYAAHQRTSRYTMAALLILACLDSQNVEWLLSGQGEWTLGEVLSNSTVKDHYCQRLREQSTL